MRKPPLIQGTALLLVAAPASVWALTWQCQVLVPGGPVAGRSHQGIEVEEVLAAVRLANEAGVRLKCSFMIGHHCDTGPAIQRSIDLANLLQDEHGVESISFLVNTAYPGTTFCERATDLGVTILSREWSDYTFDHCVITAKNLTCFDIQQGYYKALLETRMYSRAFLDQSLEALQPVASEQTSHRFVGRVSRQPGTRTLEESRRDLKLKAPSREWRR